MSKFKLVLGNVVYLIDESKDTISKRFKLLSTSAINDELKIWWEDFMYLNSESALYVYRDSKGFVTKIKLVEVKYVKGVITRTSVKVIYL